MSDERDPGDEDAGPHDAPAAALLKTAKEIGGLAAVLPVSAEAERMVGELMARNRPTGERRRKLEPRAAALRDIDSTWRRTGRR